MNRQYISTTSTLNIEAERDQIRQLEAVRDDPRRRGIQWNAGLWDRTLRRLSACEAARDAKYQQRIDDAQDDSQDQRYAELALESAIAADIDWYEQLAARHSVLVARWQSGAPASRDALAELIDHQSQITARLLALQVRLRQLGLEALERQRRATGRLADGGWAQSWAALDAAFRRQDRFHQQIAGEKAPRGASAADQEALQRRRLIAREAHAAITTQRLAWCRQMRAFQRATQRSSAALDRAGRAALSDDARRIDAMIGVLRPGAGSQLIWLAVLCLLLLLGLAYLVLQVV